MWTVIKFKKKKLRTFKERLKEKSRSRLLFLFAKNHSSKICKKQTYK